MKETGIQTGVNLKLSFLTLVLLFIGFVITAQTITADFTYTQSCETFNFTDKSSSTGGSIASYLWDFGDGESSDEQNPVHVYADEGNYLVILTVTHEIGGITDLHSESVSFFYPEAGFSYTQVCESFHFQNNSTPIDEIDSVFWYFGEGDTLRLYGEPFDADYNYVSEGEYIVFLKVFNLGCSDTLSQNVSFYRPDPNYTYTNNCQTYHFINHSTVATGNLTYAWDFGDGTGTSNLQDPVYTYALPGSYPVKLISTHESGCVDSVSKVVSFYFPEASFTYNHTCGSFQFINTSIPLIQIDSAFWFFGEGDTLKLYSQPYNASHTYSAEGEYDVFLKVFLNGCPDSYTETISFYFPDANYTYTNICKDFQFTNQSIVSNGSLTYLWNFGDGNTSTEENPAHSYLNPGLYIVSLVATHESGCTDSKVMPVSFYKPVPAFSYIGACNNFEFEDESASFGGTLINWHWDFGDGTGFSNIQNPAYSYQNPGNYPVKLVVTHSSGCQDSITHIISFDFPNAEFTFTNDCESFQFINNTTPIGEIDSVHWFFGEGDTLKLYTAPFNASYSYSTEGEFNVSLIVFNEAGCSDTVSHVVSFYHPSASFTFTNICETFQFTNESTVTIGELSYLWDFDDGITSDEENPVHVFSASGDYEVTLTVTHESGCENSFSELVSFYQPIAIFTHDPPCFGNQTCFQDQSIPNATSITAWYWDFGTGITSGVPNPCYIYAAPGQYIVLLSVKNSTGCFSEPAIDTLNVDLAPEADFSDDIACFHDTSSFFNSTDTNNIPVAFWLWNFGDPGSGANNTSDLYEPQHAFSAEGPFDVNLMVENIYGCSSSITKTVVVDSIPDAAFTSPDTIAVGVQITLIDNSIEHGIPILTRLWNFGDGFTSINPNPVIHTYTAPGEYLICLVVSNLMGCIDSTCCVIVVTDVPHADFIYSTGSDLVTNFFDDSFTESIIINWYWDFGDPLSVNDTISNNPTPSYTYPYPGYFPVYLKIFDLHSGIHDTTKIIYVGTALVADFGYTDVCLNDTTDFTDLSYTIVSAEFDSWYWEFGDGTDTTYYEQTSGFSHFFQNAGVYNVSLIVTGNINGALSVDTINKNVNVYQHPVAEIDSGYMIACLGKQILFQDSSYTIDSDSIMHWQWDFGDGTTSSQQNPSHLYVNVADYLVTLTVNTSHFCSDIDTVFTKITTSPDISFNIKNPCVNSEAVFVHTETGIEITEWLWDMGDPYSNGADTSSFEEPSHVYTRVDSYKVTMFASSYGCSKTVERTFVVKPIPFCDFNFTPNYQGVQGKTLFENSSIYANHFLWDFGNGHTSVIEDPVEIFEKDSTFIVTLTATNEYGCSDTARYDVLVFFKGLYFPTAFSPNNPYDEVSRFTPKGVNLDEYEVQVYDLRGNLLWESNELDSEGSPVESWDGYYNGILMPEGVYVWKAKGTFRDGTTWKGSELQNINPQTNGTVTLIR
jgi:PKD repeat protein